MRGGRALPKFVVHFSQTVYWINLGMGKMGRGETPAQIFCHIGVQKSGTSCLNWGGGGGRDKDKDKVKDKDKDKDKVKDNYKDKDNHESQNVENTE